MHDVIARNKLPRKYERNFTLLYKGLLMRLVFRTYDKNSKWVAIQDICYPIMCTST